MLTPARRRGVELLDDPAIDAALASRSLVDIARANALFGGQRAVLRELDVVLRELSGLPDGATRTALGSTVRNGASERQRAPLVLLDVGAGLGDIPRAAQSLAQGRGVAIRTVGVEITLALAKGTLTGADRAVCASALALPFATRSIDIVTCSQVLHHFDGETADALLRELTRVARVAVIVSDLRRSWTAAVLLWLVSFPLGFHPVSRHDGIVSIFRGYTAPELNDAVHAAIGRVPTVRHRLGWRITAMWSPE